MSNCTTKTLLITIDNPQIPIHLNLSSHIIALLNTTLDSVSLIIKYQSTDTTSNSLDEKKKEIKETYQAGRNFRFKMKLENKFKTLKHKISLGLRNVLNPVMRMCDKKQEI
jgi:hypothetical protein